MKVPAWLVLACIYVSWNLLQYTNPAWIKERPTIDRIYWFCERLFVVIAWYTVYLSVRHGRWSKFAWIPKIFVWIASIKYIYLLLVIAKLIKPNDWAALTGFCFVLTVGFILRKWERSQVNSS